MKKLLTFFFFFGVITWTYAAVKLAPIFATDMVLQQSSQVNIWGKAAPQEKVQITTSWNKKKYQTTTAADSTFHIKIETPAASFTPYTITVKATNQIDLKNVLIGEVWYCGGQSNMEQPVKGFFNQPTAGSFEDILSSENQNLRCFTVKKVSITKKQDYSMGLWTIASPNTTADFSAVAYYFGRLLQKNLKIPIGLIHCSWGGSRIEAWMSPEILADFPSAKIPQSEDDNKVKNQTPTVLYNGMLNGLFGYGIRGAIWYQGESNRPNYNEYTALFGAMHKDWISRWNIGEFPIYFCQIAPYNYNEKPEEKPFTPLLREAQAKVAATQKLTAMAVLMDAGERACIHPADKKKPGERLAYIALGKLYNLDQIQYQSPSYKNMEIVDGKVRLFFDNAPSGLSNFLLPMNNFTVSSENKIFYPAKARIAVEKGAAMVELTCDSVVNPVAARYGFTDWSTATLFGTNGLPVSSFRTDDWDEVR